MAAKRKAKKTAKKKAAPVRKAPARKAPARKAAKKAAPKKAAAEKAAPKAKRVAGKLRLSMMTGGYEIVRALQDGTVQPKGIELVIGGYAGTRGIHDQVAAGKACDINEFNGGHYVVQKAHGRDDITAIPVFLHRRFRHGFIYINTNKGITQASDLAGRRVA